MAIIEEQKILMKLVGLANPEELPDSFYENCQRIWRAFNLGRDYEKEVKNDDRKTKT